MLPMLRKLENTNMKKIKIFLASSAELKPEREQFEIEINRKNKAWFDKDIYLHLDVWEDLSIKISHESRMINFFRKKLLK